jgi:glycine/D-amino acid oxidase-like deaminating enzyme
MHGEYGAVVIGGGFFGCMTALHLRRRGTSVLVLEKGPHLLGRASYHNQARVHNGYHYPRSLTTALRSQLNFPRFVRQFESCVVRDFDQYYAVARLFSRVTARQFRNFFQRMGAPIAAAPDAIARLFDGSLIEEVFRVTEYAFDAVRLRDILQREMQSTGVEVCTGTEALQVRAGPRGRLLLRLRSDQSEEEIIAWEAFNCTYAHTNHVLAASALPLIALKQEMTEMALVEVPPPLHSIGVTVMCGPFFSVMPFPPRRLHSLSHVRWTPHDAWEEGGAGWTAADDEAARRPRQTHYPWMIHDAARYLPILRHCRYVDSLWEIKTVLPRNETDDGRPILFRRNHGLPGLHCVLGAKIDNIYDLLDELQGAASSERRSA